MKLAHTLGLAILIATSFQAFAQGEMTKPERRGHGGRPRFDEATKTAMKECFVSTGISKPERGQRPSEEERAKIDTCLKEKGITRPKRGQE